MDLEKKIPTARVARRPTPSLCELCNTNRSELVVQLYGQPKALCEECYESTKPTPKTP